MDGESGFGNGLCVPAGPLRAPVSAQLPFVQALIVLGGDDAAASRIAALARGKPLIRASLEPDALAAAPLIGREVVAFAGIARPEKFYATLRRIGAQIVATHDFADHHPYTQREIEALIEEAGRRGALLATTEKDAARLTARQARAVVALPVTLRFEEPASGQAHPASGPWQGRGLFSGLLSRDVGPFAEGARQPRSIGRDICAAEKGVAREASTRARTCCKSTPSKRLSRFDDPPTDDDRVDIPDVSALDNDASRIVHRNEIEAVGVDEDDVGLLAGRQRTGLGLEAAGAGALNGGIEGETATMREPSIRMSPRRSPILGSRVRMVAPWMRIRFMALRPP